ncbi:AVT1J [Symbiodinium pilosum]|uniref:AVT1J protein n=1 Tax=Symbiodinium pilosum TaxID=2952 RepID=A0A812IM56_SYMPI|nr:AVT1J [Symbiodinium pilosum]
MLLVLVALKLPAFVIWNHRLTSVGRREILFMNAFRDQLATSGWRVLETMHEECGIVAGLGYGLAAMAEEERSFVLRLPRPLHVRYLVTFYVKSVPITRKIRDLTVGAGLLALGPAVAHAGIPIIVLCACCAAHTTYLFGWIMLQTQAALAEGGQGKATMTAVLTGSHQGYQQESDSSDGLSSDSEGSSDASSSSGEKEKPQELPPSYESIGYQAMGLLGYVLSKVLQCLMLVGVCTIFLVLVGINAWQVERILGIAWISKRNVILAAAAFELIPCYFMATVKETFLLTALGALCSAICAVVVVAAAFTTHPGKLDGCLDGQANSWPMFTDLQGLCLCWNSVVFAFGGINVLPSLLADFHVRGVLARALVSFTWRSYLFIILIYVAVAAAGFSVGGVAMASRKVDSNVLLGLSGCPTDKATSSDWSLLVAYSVITLHVLLAFPVPFHSGAETLEATLGTREGALQPGMRGLVMRTPRLLFLGLCTTLAYTLPFFGALLDVVAAVAGQGTVFILPVLFSIAIQWQQGMQVRFYEWVLDFVCLLVGVLGAITGLYYGVQELAALR